MCTNTLEEALNTFVLSIFSILNVFIGPIVRVSSQFSQFSIYELLMNFPNEIIPQDRIIIFEIRRGDILFDQNI